MVLEANTFGSNYGTFLAAYTGTLGALTMVPGACSSLYAQVTFQASAGTTYYIQVGGFYQQTGALEFRLVTTPPPWVGIDYYPGSPSIYDNIVFHAYCGDPAWIGCETYAWDFGDGTAAEGDYTTHNYEADGDYTVELVATTKDGRTGSTSQIVQVQTHDVAITEFHTRNRAEAGETHRIVVGLSNQRPYNESVDLTLYKSVPGGDWEQIGYAHGQVPAHRANRTVDFEFAYTFTEEDATAKRVSFMAKANLSSSSWPEWPDALPGDNEAISLATQMKPLH